MVEDKDKAAFIIDFGDRGYNDVRKCVRFVSGVGVLDHAGMASYRPDIYTADEDGKLRPAKQYDTFTLDPFVEYFKQHGCKITAVSESEAAAVRKGLDKGELPADKYLKLPAPVSKPKAEAEADEKPKAVEQPVSKADLEEPEPETVKRGPGRPKGGKK